MNTRLLLYIEKKMTILAGVAGVFLSFFIENNDNTLLHWLGGSSLPCVFAITIISFFIALKGIILTIDHNKYAGLKLLQDAPREKRRLYQYFDTCIYTALFIIVINILYLVICSFNINLLNRIFIMIIISATFFILSATGRLLIILHKIQKYSLDN